MRILFLISGFAAIFGLAGVALAQGERVKISHALESRSEFYALDKGLELKRPLDVAIDEGYVTPRAYTVQPNDTLSTILERHGLRADPSSIQTLYELNEHIIEPKKLQPGQQIWILGLDKGRAIEVDQARIALDTEIKRSIGRDVANLRSKRNELDSWISVRRDVPEAVAAYEAYQDLLKNLSELRTTSYALEPETLTATDEAVSKVNELYGSIIAARRTPEANELSFLRMINDEVGGYTTAAQDYHHAWIPTEIVTINTSTNEHVQGLSVCFEPVIRRPPDPKNTCRANFDTLSSPAKKRFQYNLNYVIWAVRNGNAVSKIHRISVLPNQHDGRFVYELPVSY